MVYVCRHGGSGQSTSHSQGSQHRPGTRTVVKTGRENTCPHCTSGNVERVILYKTEFPTAQKGILDCQKASVGNPECSIYILHHHFGNPKCLFMAI